MEIKSDAPVIVIRELHIARPPASVWKVLSDIEGWPAWQPEITRAEMSGPLLPGAEFRWRVGASNIRSVLRDVLRPSRLSWTGSFMGLHAIHVWEIEATGEGCLVRSRESLEGWWLAPFRSRIQRSVERSVALWLDALARRSRQEVRCD